MELPSHNFMIRCTEGKKRHIYVLTPSAADIMKHNQELKVQGSYLFLNLYVVILGYT